MVYNGLGTLTRGLHTLFCRKFFKPHSIDEETEAQAGQVTCPVPHSYCHVSQVPISTQVSWVGVQAKNAA